MKNPNIMSSSRFDQELSKCGGTERCYGPGSPIGGLFSEASEGWAFIFLGSWTGPLPLETLIALRFKVSIIKMPDACLSPAVSDTTSSYVSHFSFTCHKKLLLKCRNSEGTGCKAAALSPTELLPRCPTYLLT